MLRLARYRHRPSCQPIDCRGDEAIGVPEIRVMMADFGGGRCGVRQTKGAKGVDGRTTRPLQVDAKLQSRVAALLPKELPLRREPVMYNDRQSEARRGLTS